jgi:hypothetical protein
MIDLEDSNVYLEVYTPTPYFIVKSILNYQKWT